MSTFRLTLTVIIAMGFILALSSVATAQLPQRTVQQLTPQYQYGGRYYVCRDPWITIAFDDVYANTRQIQGIGDSGQCNKNLYNGGSWSSYTELYQAVKAYFSVQNSAQLTITKQALPNDTWRITIDGGAQGFVRHEIISHDGGTLITSDGAGLAVSSVVSQGGGNVVSQGGGNILTNNGGTLVGSGGSSFKRIFSTSGDELRIYLGRSVVILHKSGR